MQTLIQHFVYAHQQALHHTKAKCKRWSPQHLHWMSVTLGSSYIITRHCSFLIGFISSWAFKVHFLLWLTILICEESRSSEIDFPNVWHFSKWVTKWMDVILKHQSEAIRLHLHRLTYELHTRLTWNYIKMLQKSETDGEKSHSTFRIGRNLL